MGVRTYPDQPRVYVDMDGVIADFEGALRVHGLSAAELKIKRGAYEALEVIAGAKDALHSLGGMNLEIFGLTKIPGSNPYAATEKLLWIAKHFPELRDRVIISPDKGCVGTPRDYLVDDHPEWANADRFPGTVIKFIGDWTSVVEQIRTDMLVDLVSLDRNPPEQDKERPPAPV
jgi:5'(3')-deoxyribonucleotidase